MAKKNKSLVSLNAKDWLFIIVLDLCALILCISIIIGISVFVKLVLRG